MVVCGWVIQIAEAKHQWTRLQVHRVIFLGYAVMGFIKLCLTLILSPACEAADEKIKPEITGDLSETSGLLDGYLKNGEQKKKSWFKIQTNKESIIILAKVSFLQALEAIAYGLVVK